MFGEGDLERLQDSIAGSLYYYRAKCVSVYDGDTVRLDIMLGLDVVLSNVSCRLYGINTPELRGEDKDAGIAARNRLRQLVLGEELVIQTHKDRRGKYGRYLATLWCLGININKKLIAEGYAVPYA